MEGKDTRCDIRTNKKTVLDSLHRIDIRYLKSQGALEWPGSSGRLSWSTSGKDDGSIEFRVNGETLTLNYYSRLHGEDWKFNEDIILLTRTRCHFGGERNWFLCPHCDRRVAVLFAADARFLCRHCHKLTYGCQNETYLERMVRKAIKIRRSLGATNDLSRPVEGKPNGMHWKTFSRLLKAERYVNGASVYATADKLGYTKGFPTNR